MNRSLMKSLDLESQPEKLSCDADAGTELEFSSLSPAISSRLRQPFLLEGQMNAGFALWASALTDATLPALPMTGKTEWHHSQVYFLIHLLWHFDSVGTWCDFLRVTPPSWIQGFCNLWPDCVIGNIWVRWSVRRCEPTCSLRLLSSRRSGWDTHLNLSQVVATWNFSFCPEAHTSPEWLFSF